MPPSATWWLHALRRYGWLLLLCTLVPAALVAIPLAVRPPVYEAQAQIIVTRGGIQLELDARARTEELSFPVRSLPIIIKGPQVLDATLKGAEGALRPEDRQVAAIDPLLSASNKADFSLVELSATYSTAEGAVKLVNSWADAAAERINQLTDPAGGGDLSAEVERAHRDLQQADDALVDFNKTSPIGTLQKQVEGTSGYIGLILSDAQNLELTVGTAERLRQQWTSAGTVTPGDDLSELILRVNSVMRPGTLVTPSGGGSPTTSTTAGSPQLPSYVVPSGGASLQINLDRLASPNATPAEKIQSLDVLIGALRTQRAALDDQLRAQSELLKTQQEALSREETRKNQLLLDRSTAEKTYTVLRSKADELRASQTTRTRPAQISSYAVVAPRVGGWGQYAPAVAAGAAGLLIGLLIVYSLARWRPVASRPLEAGRVPQASPDGVSAEENAPLAPQ